MMTTLIPITLGLHALGCENPVKRAVRDVAYQGYEMLGIQKRDLLKRYIASTREDQKEASETFEDALDKLRKLYAMPESQLETQYRAVKSSFEKSDQKARGVRGDREKMQTTARDLFREWEGEIEQMQSPDLKSRSREKLRASRAKFGELDHSLDASERKMQPILSHLKDHVLYLKHNLNAESLSSLRKEHDRIAGDIDGLVKDMNRAIARADEFVSTIR
jgi:ElaB/YqjD/DUF883 family membrane-anchored ribosome-binding protein